jgi:hypothetical protein
MIRTVLSGVVGLIAFGALAVTAAPASAQGWHRHEFHHHRYYRPHYYPRVMVRPYRRCWTRWQTVRVGYHWERRPVRVCR